MIKKILIQILILAFFLTSLGPLPDAHAQSMPHLPVPGMMISTSPSFKPLVLKGIKTNTNNALRFDFLIDEGASGLRGQALKDAITTLTKYFLTCLTVPESDLWVNLSPYEKDRIAPEYFGRTEMGKSLLEQDYLLKQIMASLSYPENELGRKFWQKIYLKAQEIYGTTNVSINTFNKVWIVPKTAKVYVKGDSAFVVDSKLDVMLEYDYVSMDKNIGQGPAPTEKYAQIVREIILPELRREINEGKNFAVVRQVFNAMILATWYKKHLKSSVLSQEYVGKNKITGVDAQDKNIKEKIFLQYLKAYKKLVYNYIREDYDSSNQTVIPRKYASGGMDFIGFGLQTKHVYSEIENSQGMDLGSDLAMATIDLNATDEHGSIVRFPDQRTLTNKHPFKLIEGEVRNSIPRLVGGKERDFAQKSATTYSRSMDFLGWSSGMVIATSTVGWDPVSLITTAVALPFITRALYALNIGVHEVGGHAVSSAVFHPHRSKEALSVNNLKANFSLNQWLQIILPWRQIPKENPYVLFSSEGWRKKTIHYTGFAATWLTTVATAISAYFLGLEHSWVLPLLGPIGVSGWNAIKASWKSDIKKLPVDSDKFECGNYGVFWVDESNQGLYPQWVQEGVDGLMRRLIVRGGQSAGQVMIDGSNGEANVYLTKVVKSKRGAGSDLVSSLLSEFRQDIKGAKHSADSEVMVHGVNGHVRFATGGAVSKRASHPFLGPKEERLQWAISDGKLVVHKKEVLVTTSHNGDNDYYYLHDRMLDLTEIREFFGKVVHMKKDVWIPPDPERGTQGRYDYMPEGDSPPTAPEIHFHLTQGSWRGSIRYAHVMVNHKTADEALGDILNIEEEDAMAQLFEEIFIQDAPGLSRPDLGANKEFKDLWVSKDMANQWPDLKFQYHKINAFKEKLVKRLEAEGSKQTPAGEILRRWNQSQETRIRFVDMAVERFFIGNRFQATLDFKERAEGSYGLVVRTSLQNDGVTLFSKSQGMAFGFNVMKKFLSFASDPLVLLGKFGSKGSLEKLFMLDPRKDEVADIGFSKTKAFYVRVRSSGNKDLTPEQISQRLYSLNEDNPYYKPPIEYKDPQNIIDEDLERTSNAISTKVKDWENPRSFDYQSAEAFAEMASSRYVEDFLKKHSLTYSLLRADVVRRIHKFLQDCESGQVVCSEDQKKFLHQDSISWENSLIVAIIESQASNFIISYAEDLNKKLLSRQIKDEDLIKHAEQMDHELQVFTELQIKIILDDLIANFDRSISSLRQKQKTLNNKDDSNNTVLDISGYEKSLWLGENFKQLLHIFMPKMPIETNSSNKKLRDPLSKINNRTIGLIISLSGSTFPSMALAGLLNKITQGNTFVMTSRLDAMINMALGQRLTPDAPFTRRIFTTGDYYPAEAAPTSDILLFAEQILLTRHLVKRLREVFPHHNPWGLQVQESDLKRLEDMIQGMIKDSKRITGVDEQGRDIKSKVHQELINHGQYLGGHLLETPKVNFIFRAFVASIFYMGAPVHLAMNALGCPPGPALRSMSGFWATTADFMVAVWAPFLITTLIYRTFTGRPRWARMGPPSMVIGDLPFVHQISTAFVSKMGARAPGSMTMNVHGGNPEDHLGARFTHRIVRGLQLISALPVDQMAKEAVKVTLRQAKAVRNGIFGNRLVSGAEVTTIGREDFSDKNITDHHINIQGQILNATDSEVIKKMNNLAFDPLGRLMAYKVMFNAMYKKASTISIFPEFTINLGLFKMSIKPQDIHLWNRAWTYPSISVHTTRSPIGIDPQTVAKVEEIGKSPSDQAMMTANPVKGLSEIKGGIDMDSHLLDLQEQGTNQPSIEPFSIQSIYGITPEVVMVVPVSQSMIHTLLAE